jgi:hypothetical protein
MEPDDKVKLAEVHTNVKILLSFLPKVQELDKDSAVNKTQHKMLMSILLTPIVYWICHKLGVEFF